MATKYEVRVRTTKGYAFTGLYLSVPTRSEVQSDIDTQSLEVEGKQALQDVVENVRPWPKNLPVSITAVARDNSGRRLGSVAFTVKHKKVLR